MNEFDYKTLLEKRWRQKLTAAEEASVREWLARHPESKAEWDLETELAGALERLPDVPVPSNFTARVMQAVETAAPRRSPNRVKWFLRVALPRTAVAAAVFGAVLLTWHENATTKRAELVQGVKMVAGVSSLPSPEFLLNFDTIRQMPASTGPDAELNELMK